MPAPRTVKPVSFAETDSRYRTVNTAEAMGRALLTHCDQADGDFQRAAASCIGLQEGEIRPEQARADFIRALQTAGVHVKDA